MPLDANLAALQQVESGGIANPYGNATLDTNGIMSYGAYQIQAPNIGPWSQAALGYSMTPQQFLASPSAQDQIAQYQFNNYLAAYGSPQAAAAAWNGGPNAGAMYAASGTSYNQGYVDKFNGALNSGAGYTADAFGNVYGPGGTMWDANGTQYNSQGQPLGANGQPFMGPSSSAASGSGWFGVISQYFMRGTIVVLGFIFVFAGLMMFKGDTVTEALTLKTLRGAK
jgi:hypothetical protein